MTQWENAWFGLDLSVQRELVEVSIRSAPCSLLAWHFWCSTKNPKSQTSWIIKSYPIYLLSKFTDSGTWYSQKTLLLRFNNKHKLWGFFSELYPLSSSSTSSKSRKEQRKYFNWYFFGFISWWFIAVPYPKFNQMSDKNKPPLNIWNNPGVRIFQ